MKNLLENEENNNYITNGLEILNKLYTNSITNPSDINEHVPILKKYSENCEHITELGVRDCVSTYGFLKGLLENNCQNKTLVGVDPYRSKNIDTIESICKEVQIDYIFINKSDLDINIDNTDLLFIDTWHCYGQLIRELNKHHNNVNKYIIMHDTTVDEWTSEVIRIPNRWQNKKKKKYQKIIRQSGFNEYELKTGLWPAIKKFLDENKCWSIKERYTNNNGLTILEKH